MWGWAAADGVDWSRQLHAYGIATDTPGELRALVGDDPAAQRAGVQHLQAAVLHQGTLFPVTPVVVRVVAGLLDAQALRRNGSRGRPVLAEVLAWLGEVAGSAWAIEPDPPLQPPSEQELADLYARLRAGSDPDDADPDDADPDVADPDDDCSDDDPDVWGSPVLDAVFQLAVADLHAVAPELVTAVLAYLGDPDDAVRTAALAAAVRWARLPAAQALRGDVATRVRAGVTAVTSREDRAVAVQALGLLGADTTGWLADDDPAVRAIAALSCPQHPGSTPLLVTALTRPLEVDAWFAGPLPFGTGAIRSTLLHELLERGVPFAELLPAALAVAEVADGWTADADWGPLLRAAFPDVVFVPGVRPPAPVVRDEAQRAFLQALVANASLWDPRNGSAYLARMRVGLPEDRDAVAALAAG